MMKRKLIALFLLITLLLSEGVKAVDISAKGACTINYETGEIIYEKNAQEQMSTASLTKIMTLYIVFEKIADGTLSKDTLIPISQNAATLSGKSGYSNIPLTAGSSLPADTLIQAIVTVSACACCTAVGEYLCGSEAEFVKLMNETVADMEISAHFVDAAGISGDNTISPEGMAKLTYIFIKKHPDILNYTSKPTALVNGRYYSSTNLLISANSDFFYSGADGFKTGTTKRAGKCLVSTAVRDGGRIINVVMNSESNSSRYTDTIQLLNSAFSKINLKNTYLYSTDIKTFIDGYEIPCCYFLGEGSTLCVVAENLKSFGFDTQYDNNTDTLYIYDNPSKEIYTMVPGDDLPMQPIYKIYNRNTRKVVLVTDNGQYPLSTVFSLSGQTAISLDELCKYFPSSWEDSSRQLHLYKKAG